MAILGVSDLVIVRPHQVEDIHDLPGTDGPLCEAMTSDAASMNSEVTCVRPARHEGDCEDLWGLLWDHEDDCGCHDDDPA
jgi:hypothetical protein